MTTAYQIIPFGPEDLVEVGRLGNDPVYGYVDGIPLRLSKHGMLQPPPLEGYSAQSLRRVLIWKTERVYTGALLVRVNDREEIEVLNESENSLQTLIHRMNRLTFLLRKSLDDTIY